MTRAEERALEAYPYKIEEHPKVMCGVITYDANKQPRVFFQEGYEQAEKDLGLTWEDMQRIVEIYYTLHDSYKGNSNIYNEVLRRFNKSKEEKK